jgi:hypothetical protein
MGETELVSKYMPGWSLRDIKEMPVRERRFWAQTALYRVKGN